MLKLSKPLTRTEHAGRGVRVAALTLAAFLAVLPLTSCGKAETQSGGSKIQTSQSMPAAAGGPIVTAPHTDKLPDVKENHKNWKILDGSSFYMNAQGEAVSAQAVSGKRVLDWFFEPCCPDCFLLDKDIDGHYDSFLNDKVVTRIYPVSYIGKTTDTRSYQAAAILLGVAEYEPKLAGKFMAEMMKPEFAYAQPEFEKPVNLTPLHDLLLKLGGKEETWKLIEEQKPALLACARENFLYLRKDKRWQELSPTPTLSVPYLYMEGAAKAANLNFLAKPAELLKQYVEAALESGTTP